MGNLSPYTDVPLTRFLHKFASLFEMQWTRLPCTAGCAKLRNCVSVLRARKAIVSFHHLDHQPPGLDIVRPQKKNCGSMLTHVVVAVALNGVASPHPSRLLNGSNTGSQKSIFWSARAAHPLVMPNTATDGTCRASIQPHSCWWRDTLARGTIILPSSSGLREGLAWRD